MHISYIFSSNACFLRFSSLWTCSALLRFSSKRRRHPPVLSCWDIAWREDVFLFLRPPTPHLLRVKQCQAADHATNENGQSTRSLQSIFTHNHHKASQPIATLRWSYHPYYFGDTSRLQQSHHHDETLHVIEEVILLFLSITQSTKLRLRLTEDNRYSSYQ